MAEKKKLDGISKVANSALVEICNTSQKTHGIASAVLKGKEIQDFSERHVRPYVALKYYNSDFECFSDWQQNELREFSDLSRKLAELTWQDIYKSGGKSGSKTGLGYTQIDLNTLKNEAAKRKLLELHRRISEDITFFELRVGSKPRVHGFRSSEAFFLVLLDREHQVFTV